MESVTPEELYLYCKADSEEQQLLADQLADANEALQTNLRQVGLKIAIIP